METTLRRALGMFGVRGRARFSDLRLRVTEWQGQAELRAWHRPGEAMADLYVRWSTGDASGGWHVEVDRGTESRHALRRKLFRYLHTPDRVALVVTTSDERVIHESSCA